MDWDDIRQVRIHARAAECRIEELQAEIAALRNDVKAWADYAFTHHGDDATLCIALAGLSGMTPTCVQQRDKV